MSICIEAEEARQILIEIFVKSGLDIEMASTVADNLVLAEMRNILLR